MESKDMTGVLFRVSKKKSERSPDYTGNVVIGGEKYRLAGWLKMSRKGDEYLSLAVSEEEGKVPF